MTTTTAQPSTRTVGIHWNQLADTEAAIRFDQVVKQYDDGTTAVDGVSFTCPAQQITVFVGPSGCGKTTSLRMINRMIAPTHGQISIGGIDTSRLEETTLRRHMGYVIQNAGLFPHRRIIDNIAAVPRLLGTPRTRARADALELMRRVGLSEDLASRFPYQLSGGQQQRVGVARALASDPPVLLMDEPFSAIDPVVRVNLQDELLRLQSEIGKTIVLVTHDIDEAVKLADQIVVFQTGGTVAQIGTPIDLLMQPANDFVREFIGTDAGLRWLSLLPASTLPLGGGNELPHGWRLTLDANGVPAAWQRANDDTGRTLPVSTFSIASASLRDALDLCVRSEVGVVSAVDAAGRHLGFIDQTSIAHAISENRAHHG